jgi:nitrite reductase/ring-hydroxylating ferredoxin subunit
MEGFVAVGRLEEFKPGVMVPINAEGLDIAVCNIDGELHAFDNFCPHEAVTLTSGYGAVHGGNVICMMHTSVFDIATGEVLAGPADTGLSKYPVEVEDGVVYVAATPSH